MPGEKSALSDALGAARARVHVVVRVETFSKWDNLKPGRRVRRPGGAPLAGEWQRITSRFHGKVSGKVNRALAGDTPTSKVNWTTFALACTFECGVCVCGCVGLCFCVMFGATEWMRRLVSASFNLLSLPQHPLHIRTPRILVRMRPVVLMTVIVIEDEP
jgi:hypothetical protein